MTESIEPVSILLKRNMEIIVGAQRIKKMRGRFQWHYIDSLTDEQSDAVLGFSVLPRVFVEWYRQGCPDFLDGLAQLSVTLDNPFEPLVVLFLDGNKPFPVYYTKWDTFAGMPMYVHRFK